jgi:hypothetical protein
MLLLVLLMLLMLLSLLLSLWCRRSSQWATGADHHTRSANQWSPSRNCFGSTMYRLP